MSRLNLKITSILKRLKVSKLVLGLFILNMQSAFGVLEFLHWNHPWNNYKYSCKKDLEKAVSLMQEAGIGWLRMDFLWEDIEPKKVNLNLPNTITS